MADMTAVIRGRERLDEELILVSSAREGDFNDDHIAALEGALSVALDLLDIVGGYGGTDAERYRRGALG